MSSMTSIPETPRTSSLRAGSPKSASLSLGTGIVKKASMKSVHSGIQVMIRCRPFNKREEVWFAERDQDAVPVLSMDDSTVTVLDPANGYEPRDAFAYHHCYWSCTGHSTDVPQASQEDVYSTSGRPLLEKALGGYNGTVFAYGQTGSGKTYSMLGGPDNPGISYLLIRDLFQHIDREQVASPTTLYTVEISFMEIYNEQVRDLFCKKAKAGEYKPVKIRQHPVLGIQVEGLERLTVRSAQECEMTMEQGVGERALAETKMNATSSRSHAICQISLVQADSDTGLRRNSVLNIVDLAGSERLKMTGAEGTQLLEAKNINKSLSTLRKVFDVLIDNSKKNTKAVPPYRESMLTWVLKESLGGNSQTFMIAAVSPSEESIEDTISTLRYAQKAKAIVNKVIHNEQPNAKMVQTLKLQVELLQKQLVEKLSGGISLPKGVFSPTTSADFLSPRLQTSSFESASPCDRDLLMKYNTSTFNAHSSPDLCTPDCNCTFLTDEERDMLLQRVAPPEEVPVADDDEDRPLLSKLSLSGHNMHRSRDDCPPDCKKCEFLSREERDRLLRRYAPQQADCTENCPPGECKCGIRILSEREKIRTKFNSEIDATKQALGEAESLEVSMRNRQIELEERVKELEATGAALKFDVCAERKRNFSQAFRTAFRLRKEKEHVEVKEKELASVEAIREASSTRLNQHVINEEKLTHRIDILTRENHRLNKRNTWNALIFAGLCLATLVTSLCLIVFHFA